jgi:hypothetical protein
VRSAFGTIAVRVLVPVFPSRPIAMIFTLLRP